MNVDVGNAEPRKANKLILIRYIRIDLLSELKNKININNIINCSVKRIKEEIIFKSVV
jgi:hypothetical protein